MADTNTPICDLIEKLLSRGLSPGDTLEAARLVEEEATIRRASNPDQREKWRVKKARQRAKTGDMSPGTGGQVLSTTESPKTQDLFKKERIEDSECPPVPGDILPDDGWPEDYREQFWMNFPKKRRYEKTQVMALLAKMRREKTVEWPVLFDGVLRYAASDLGEGDRYAKAPLPWLRGQRWMGDYRPKTVTQKGSGSRGRTTFGDLASMAEELLNGG